MESESSPDHTAEQQESSKVPPQLREFAFKPGQSGNPNGRKPGTAISDKLKKFLEDVESDGRSGAQIMADIARDAAKTGDFRFWEAIVNRTEGKVPDRIAGPDGEPLKVYLADGDASPMDDV